MQTTSLRSNRGQVATQFQQQPQPSHGAPTFQQPQFPQSMPSFTQQRGTPSPMMQPLPPMPPSQFPQQTAQQRRRSTQNQNDYNQRLSYDSPQLNSMSSSVRVPDVGSGSGSLTRSSMRSSNGNMSDNAYAMPATHDTSAEVVIREQRSLTVQPQSYSVVQEIGSGGAGKAFLVRGKEDGQTYVAKQITCLGDKYRAAPASYALHETRLMFLLRHPHIVELLDFYPKSSLFSIIMEYCEQGDLSRHIESGIRQGKKPFEAERIYTWWYQILDAIDYCHAKGIIHRDLKPKNIFLDRNLDAKIGDFGVSALVSFPPAAERVGTITYHSPEVQSSLSYSTYSDIWSIGCIMWEAMVLRPSGGDPIVLQAINLSAIAQAYGNAARNLLIQHLQAEPEHRSSAGYLKESLMKELAAGTRERMAAKAAASVAATKRYAERQRGWMTPKHIPDSILPRQEAEPSPVVAAHPEAPNSARDYSETGPKPTPQMDTPVVPDLRVQDRADNVALFPPGANDRGQQPPALETERTEPREMPVPSQRAATDIYSRATIVPAEPHSARSTASSATARSTNDIVTSRQPSGEAPANSKESNELGIDLSAGAGGEYGAWKISRLDPTKGAGMSGEVQVGEFLWEINRKVIFGMPLNAIMGLLKGKPGSKVTLGLKAGLGLPIRHVTLNADGSFSPSPSLSVQGSSPALPPVLADEVKANSDATTITATPAASTDPTTKDEQPAEQHPAPSAASASTSQGALLAAPAAPQPPLDPRPPSQGSEARASPAAGSPPAAEPAAPSRSPPPVAREASPPAESSPAITDSASPQLTPESLTPRPAEASTEDSPGATASNAAASHDALRSAPSAMVRSASPPAQSTPPVAGSDPTLRSSASPPADPLPPSARSPPSAELLADRATETQNRTAAVPRAAQHEAASHSSPTWPAESTQPAPTRSSPAPVVHGSQPAPLVASRSSPPMEGQPALRHASPEASAAVSSRSPPPSSDSIYARPARSISPSAAADPQPLADRRSSPPLAPDHQGAAARPIPYMREPERAYPSAARSDSPGAPEAPNRSPPAPSDAEGEPSTFGVVGSRLSPAAPAPARPKNEIVPVRVSSAVARVVSAETGGDYAPRISSAPRAPAVGSAQIAGEGQYSGELREGKPFGKGTATWPQQGHTYVGEWRNGVMHGQGTATYLNGDRYDGEWSNGKRSGLGRYAHGSGDVFEGLWANERKDTLGVDTFADGRGYRGEFRENKFAGVGTYFTLDGAMYQGDWFQGKAHGHGISLSAKGGNPAFVQYAHGNLTQSELMGKDEHFDLQNRVQQRSIAAVQTALRARRVAASIQHASIGSSSREMQELEHEVGGDAIVPSAGTSLLGKVVHMLVGINTAMHDDSTLLVTSFEAGSDGGRAMPLAVGDLIAEVSERSCSWFKGMALEEILVHLQVSKREAGFVV